MAYNHERSAETVVLSVTIANRRLWCRLLWDAKQVLTGRRNSLREAIKTVAGQQLGEFGQITDVLASLDIKYESPIEPSLHNSVENIFARIHADCDIHIHALICLTPYNQQVMKDRDWANLAQQHLRQVLPWPYDVNVQHLDHGITRARLISVGILKSDLSPLLESVVYNLAYQTKMTTLDSVSSRERPVVQAAIAGAFKHGKGITLGKPILVRSRFHEDVAQSLLDGEEKYAERVSDIERDTYRAARAGRQRS